MHMLRPLLLRLVVLMAALMLGTGARAAGDDLAIVAHPSVPKLDLPTLQRLYTGRIVEVNGQNLTVVNAAPGSAVRQRFLAAVVQQDDEKYRAYWTVRRHIGKGTPPRELRNATEVQDFVQATPGAVGYVLASELRPGLNVIARIAAP